ncbi:hypothetical protein [Aquimarina spongiae]|uniref:Uncharacterized protein n=1 Tax=Aquimarina spongiae TaxID=570521 RepID=A0A1M6IX36_9FLAO|nr:hypothetical protein [Aquimarina spongiae]SHJ39036.1 hypothetical protein SAMN04488508_108118 [Aquimarina spongiae]
MRVEILFKRFFHWVVIALTTGWVYGQPVYDSKRMIDGVSLYKDHVDPHVFYYEPGKLKLKILSDGTPDFQFLDMRYTGSKCYNDRGEKSFMSLLQVGVEMQKMDKDFMKRVKVKLPPKSKIIPLSISGIETQLIIPSTGSDHSKKDVVKKGVLESSGKESVSTSRGYWETRVLTIRLNQYESQILMDCLKKKTLGLSLQYSFYADFLGKSDIEFTGSKEVEEHLYTKEEEDKEIVENRIIQSDALPIKVDVEQYPDVVKQLDLNEEIPPAYAGLEIKCYDFKENIRPDLFMKIVEIEAQSVDGAETVKQEVKFLKKNTDLHTYHISFPYAIYVDTPMRYRITEIDIEGKRTIFDWKEKAECSSELDVTTPVKNQNLISKLIEVEIDSENLWQRFDEVSVFFAYMFNGKSKLKEVRFEKETSSIVKETPLTYDKRNPIHYVISSSKDTVTTRRGPNTLIDDYLFISQ